MAEGDRAAKRAAAFADVPSFVHGLAFDRLPDEAVASARRSLLDLIGVAAAGSRTPASAIARTYAATQLCGSDRNARILFDGRRRDWPVPLLQAPHDRLARRSRRP